MLNKFNQESLQLQYYLWLFLRIKSGKSINQANFYEIHNDKFEGKYEITFQDMNEANKLIEALRVVIQLFTKISTYPKVKDLSKIQEEIKNNKEKLIDPYLDKNLKGMDWLSLSIHIILYNLLTESDLILDDDLKKLYSICKQLKGKSIDNEFLKKFFDFCYLYIKNNIILELPE